MRIVRNLIAARVRELVGSRAANGAPMLDLETGDLGLFGPDTVCWRVHGDFTTMMVGGVTALLLQMLHPGALAGVWDHSNFREDMSGRLRGTAQFIAGTTYASTAEAERLIGRVLSIHGKVSGVLPDGAAYSANDPDLLTWVHVAEVSSFLAAYLRHRDPTLSLADQDRYYDEVAVIARRLGAIEVPRSRVEVDAYLARVRPQLVYDARTRDVVHALMHPTQPAGPPAFAALVFGAAEDLLPDWAARMHGFKPAAARRPMLRFGIHGVGSVLRWALLDSAEMRGRRRAARLLGEGQPL
jgi:uncharacterized protein (DUF2236 family)